MASSINDLFTPGWTTSKPGDMKNSGGLTTRFAKPETHKWPDIKVEPRTEFDLDLTWPAKAPGTAEDFNRDYMASFAGVTAEMIKGGSINASTINDSTYGAAATTTLTVESIEKMKREIERMSGTHNPDTPESASPDAW